MVVLVYVRQLILNLMEHAYAQQITLLLKEFVIVVLNHIVKYVLVVIIVVNVSIILSL